MLHPTNRQATAYYWLAYVERRKGVPRPKIMLSDRGRPSLFPHVFCDTLPRPDLTFLWIFLHDVSSATINWEIRTLDQLIR